METPNQQWSQWLNGHTPQKTTRNFVAFKIPANEVKSVPPTNSIERVGYSLQHALGWVNYDSAERPGLHVNVPIGVVCGASQIAIDGQTDRLVQGDFWVICKREFYEARSVTPVAEPERKVFASFAEQMAYVQKNLNTLPVAQVEAPTASDVESEDCAEPFEALDEKYVETARVTIEEDEIEASCTVTVYTDMPIVTFRVVRPSASDESDCTCDPLS